MKASGSIYSKLSRQAGLLQGISIERRIKDILQFARRFKQKGDPFREKAIDALCVESGFPHRMSEKIVQQLFGRISPRQLKDLHDTQCRQGSLSDADVVGLVAPSNVPDPFIVSLIGLWLGGNACWLKLSKYNRYFGRVVLEAIRATCPVFSKAIKSTTDKAQFFKNAKDLKVCIAFGNDLTLQAIRQELAVRSKLIEHGHRFSMGIVLKSVLNKKNIKQTIHKCALDVWLYDQRGCLSPQIYYVEKGSLDFAYKLQRELHRLAGYYGLPHRPHKVSSVRRIALDRLQTESLDPRLLVFCKEGIIKEEPLVYHLNKSSFRHMGIGQIVAVKGFEDADHIIRSLRTTKKYIESVSIGTKLWQADSKKIEKLFEKTSVSRFCPIGRIQDPSLSWQFRI